MRSWRGWPVSCVTPWWNGNGSISHHILDSLGIASTDRCRLLHHILRHRSILTHYDRIMTCNKSLNMLRTAFTTFRPRTSALHVLKTSASRRCIHQGAKVPSITSSKASHRPVLQPYSQAVAFSVPRASPGSRTIFIQTQQTPNADVGQS